DADYLCLPELLRRAGYPTEMIAAQQEDINNLSTFTARNGIERFIDEHHVDGERQHLGIGLTDRALFDALAARVRHYQSTGERFLLLTLTVGTHHPFTVPHDDAEVVALSKVEDGYPGALRVADRELARFLSDLRRDNLLRDTVVVVLGDHGRHEPTGTTPWERQIGHFLAPLFIWMPDDDSAIPAPAVIKTVTSQVDVAPTLLALNGLLPRQNAFMGRDVSCLFAGVCAAENAAYLSSVYDDIVGVADQQGIAVVSLRSGAFASGDLALSQRPATDATPVSN